MLHDANHATAKPSPPHIIAFEYSYSIYLCTAFISALYDAYVNELIYRSGQQNYHCPYKLASISIVANYVRLKLCVPASAVRHAIMQLNRYVRFKTRA